MSQYCSKCGTPLAGDEAFCQNCGAKVDVEQQVSEQAAAQTPPIPPQQAQVPQQSYVQPVQKKKGLGTGAIIGIVVGAVVVVAALLLLLLGVFGGGGNTVTSTGSDVGDIEGRWYSSTTLIDFDDDGTLEIKIGDEEYDGEYTYDPDDEEGEIESDLGDFDGVDFELKSDYMKIGDEKYYRDKEEAGYGQQVFAGLWQAVETTLAGQTVDTAFMGMAFELAADGSVSEYETFARSETGTWDELESGDLKLTNEDNEVVTLANIVMDADGQTFTADVTSDGMTGSVRFVKTDMDAFMEQKNDLLLKLQGFWWVCGTNEYPPVDNYVLNEGLAIQFRGMKMDFHAGFEVDTLDIDYEFVDGDTIHYYEDGDEYTVDIAFETIGGSEYLVMTGAIETLYLMPSNQAEYMAGPPEPTVPPQPSVDTTYTSDADIRALIVREWTAKHYLEADGTIDMNITFLDQTFFADGTIETVEEGTAKMGKWTVQDGRLSVVYDNGSDPSWPVFIDYVASTHTYLLYKEMDENSPGEYFVYTDSTSLTSAPPTDATAFGSLEAAEWRSQDLFEQAMMNGAWQYSETVDFPSNMNVPEYADATPAAPRVLQFGTDDMLSVTYMGSGSLPDDMTGEYGFGFYCAYVEIDSYDAPDELYEVNIHYYINKDGNLVETIRMYSYDRDEFYAVSNANVYVPYEP